jgi:hypothetical protein
VAAGRVRGVAAELLISLGILALAVSAMSSVARRALFFSDNFANHVAASLKDPRVASFVADRITNAILKENPDLTAFRPLILATTHGAVASTPFQALMRTAARSAHASLFSETGRDVIVSVPDVGVLLSSALSKANPSLAQKIPARVTGTVASLGASGIDRFVLRLGRIVRRSAWLTLILFAFGLVAALAGVFMAPSRRRAMVRLGLDLVVAGVALLLLVPAGRVLVSTLPHTALGRAAAAGLWDAFMGSLRIWGLVFGGIGLVLAAAGQSLIEHIDPGERLRRIAVRLQKPATSPRGELLRGAALLGLGTLAVLYPASAATLVMLVLGAAFAFEGLRHIFQIVLKALPESDAATNTASSVRLRVVVVLAVAAVFVIGIAFAGRQPARLAPVVRDACNGSPELCGRRLDEVVFPATHNAMSAADIPDWLFPQQEKSLPGQLEDGIRALLIDLHYGIPVAGRVKTDLDHEIGSRAKLEPAVGKEGLDAAMRIRDRLAGKEEGQQGVYLCHGFCELGATPLVSALSEVHQFLVENPDEVLVLVLEDYVTPQDIAAAFEKSGLDGLVYRGPVGPPWPTLREMIDSRQRVLVLTESDRTGIPWIHPGYAGILQETPYHFEKPSELSCVPKRGGTEGSFFLMNNWIDTTPAPKPSNAAIVNAYHALLARARECQAERGRLPNIIAVDFYRTGALLDVARTLNAERRGS